MKCSFRRLPQHAGRICWRRHSDGEGGEEQRWRERGVSILHSHKQRGWAGGTQKQRIVFLSFLVHSRSFLHLFCASYLSSLLSFVLLSTFLCFWSSVSALSALSFQSLASALSSSSVFHTIFEHKGQRVWQDDVLWRRRDLKMDTQIYGQTEFKETRSVPEGQRQQQQKKPWKCYFSSFTSDSWNVSLTERQTASQQIRRQRARSVLNAVTCPKSVSPPGCYDLTMLWVYVRVQMEHCCNWILPLKKAVTLLY